MLLLIFESIGTSELILIGIIALIFLGPRKLPQIARTIGKTMADFRRTTNEFKSTWEREVNFEEEDHTKEIPSGPRVESIAVAHQPPEYPEVRPVDDEETLNRIMPEGSRKTESSAVTDDGSDKRNWL